jgi:cytochrome c oxidase assembly factor CtaG
MAAVVLAFGPGSTWFRWSFEPTVVLPIAFAGAAYLHAVGLVERRRSGARTAWRGPTACFLAGLGVLVVALVSPVDALADDSLAVHMVQHLLLTLVAPPLLLLGRPITLAYAASSARTSSRIAAVARTPIVRFLGSPAFGFAAFSLVLWASHVSPLYEATLTNERLHAAEHAAYLITATLFWWPIVATDPGARRLSYPGRLFYLFLSMPVMSLLGFLIASDHRILFPHYVVAAGSVAAALRDQQLGGTVMWESSMLGGAIALALVLAAWMRYEDVQTRRVEALRARTSVSVEGNDG